VILSDVSHNDSGSKSKNSSGDNAVAARCGRGSVEARRGSSHFRASGIVLRITITLARRAFHPFIFEPAPVGKKVGIYVGTEITEFVIDGFGGLSVYCGIALRGSDGRLITNNLRTREFVLKPGLIYRLLG
jgi:hypothetical protein